MNGHDKDGKERDEHKLLDAILAVLVETERQNQKRHNALLAEMRGNVNVLEKLNGLRARLAKVAKAVAALDAQTQ